MTSWLSLRIAVINLLPPLHSNKTRPSLASHLKNYSTEVHLTVPQSPKPHPTKHLLCSRALLKKHAPTLTSAAKEALTFSLTLLAPSAAPCWRKPPSRLELRLIVPFPVRVFMSSSRSHQPGAKGEVHPSRRSVSGSGRLPVPGPSLQAGLSERLAHPLLFLGLPQRSFPPLCSLCPGHPDGLCIIQGKVFPSSHYTALMTEQGYKHWVINIYSKFRTNSGLKVAFVTL